MKTIREFIKSTDMPDAMGGSAIYQDFDGFLYRLNKVMELIPEQYRQEAMIHIYGTEDYGDVFLTLEVYYDRALTEEEIQAEKTASEQRRNKEIEQAIATLKKYGKL